MATTGVPIKLHNDIGIFAILPLGGGLERGLDRREHDLLVDVLVAMQRVNVSKNVLGIHAVKTVPMEGLER